jgi:hypothetical protein
MSPILIYEVNYLENQAYKSFLAAERPSLLIKEVLASSQSMPKDASFVAFVASIILMRASFLSYANKGVRHVKGVQRPAVGFGQFFRVQLAPFFMSSRLSFAEPVQVV